MIVCNGEVYLFGCYISVLISIFMYVYLEIICICKLFLNVVEISKLIGKVECFGYMLVLLNLYYSKGCVKCDIGLVKGKK